MYHSHVLTEARKKRLLHDVTIELTYQCNLDCFYCYNDREKPGKPLSLSQYQQLLHDLADMETMYIMLTGGEPMIHPHFFEIGQLAKELGFVVRVRTNGHSLSRNVVKRLVDEVDPFLVEVSLHGATADTHDQQTRVPGSFDRLIRNIQYATEAGLHVNVVTTPTKWNEHQIVEMCELCDQLGVKIRFQGPVSPRDNGDLTPLEISPKDSTWDDVNALVKLRRSKEPSRQRVSTSIPVKISKTKDFSKQEEYIATCSVGQSSVDIDPYGNIQACMHLQESAGSLHQQSIKEIWQESPLFLRAQQRAVDAAKRFEDQPVRQLGAHLFCLAVEENLNKGGCGSCETPCGSHLSA